MSDALDEPDFIAIRCGTCQARLRIRSKLAGTTGVCPKCGASISIPHRPEIEFELPHPSSSEPSVTPDGSYRLAKPLDFQPDDNPEPLPPELRPVAPSVGYLDQLARNQPRLKEPRPRYLFFSGVFDFPWYPEVWLRWLFLVIGGAAATMIPMFAVAFLGGSSGYAGVGVAFFAMPQIWISIWTLSFAASCGFQIFDDTASGSNHVSSWPDPNWREWMWPLMHLGYVFAMVLAIGYGFGLALANESATIIKSIVLAEHLLFPLCLLSVLEANNLAILVSPRLLRTLFRHAINWLQFYLLTGCLFGAWYAILRWCLQIHPLLLVVINGLLYASVALIWFRLLGRLAWAISHRRSQKCRP